MSRKVSLGFVLQIDFSFFNVESICGFTSTFVATFYSTSYTFVYKPIKKCLPLDILKFPVTILRNKGNKFALILFDEDGTLVRFSQFMKTCHNMITIFKTIGGYLFSLNGKS